MFDKPVGGYLETVRSLFCAVPANLKLPAAQHSLIRLMSETLIVSEDDPSMVAVYCRSEDIPGFDAARERFFFDKWIRDRIVGHSVLVGDGEWLFVVGHMCGEPAELERKLRAESGLLRRARGALSR
jgi:hypothetical protein